MVGVNLYWLGSPPTQHRRQGVPEADLAKGVGSAKWLIMSILHNLLTSSELHLR